MSRLSYAIVLFFFLSFIYSDFVSIDKAELVAKNIIISNELLDTENLVVESIYTIEKNSIVLIYAINIKDKGFVLVAADDRVFPVLGYSFNHYYSDNNHPIQFSQNRQYSRSISSFQYTSK